MMSYQKPYEVNLSELYSVNQSLLNLAIDNISSQYDLVPLCSS